MDLVNYAVLVIDIAPNMATLQGYDMTNTSISFTSMSMTSSKLLYMQPNNTDNVVTTIVQSIKQVTEGWESQLNSTNAGYGIVIALVIVLCATFAILFFLTMKRINDSKRKVVNL